MRSLAYRLHDSGPKCGGQEKAGCVADSVAG